MLKMAVLASGRGSNFLAIADAVSAGDIDGRIEVLISDRPGAKALEHARERSIEARALDRHTYATMEAFEADLLRLLRAYDIDVVVLAGYMRIIGAKFLQELKLPVINIHPSLLPAFPGLEAQKKALEYGVKIAGCTVHFVDESLDGGPIIAQRAVPVLPGDDVDDLAARILIEEHQLYPAVLAAMAEGRIECYGRRIMIKEEEGEKE